MKCSSPCVLTEEEAKDIERKRMERYKKEIEQLKNKRVDYLD